MAGVSTATPPELACTDRSLLLLDVLERNGRVSLYGAADRDLIGRTVSIRLKDTGRIVAKAVVGADGYYKTTAKLPRKSVRNTERARYTAEIGTERSSSLKLRRRLSVTSITVSGGLVTIKGRVTKPFTAPRATVKITRRVSCTRTTTVKTVAVGKDGRFTAKVTAPSGTSWAVYRATTSVRSTTRSRKSNRTYTLPRGVALDGR